MARGNIDSLFRHEPRYIKGHRKVIFGLSLMFVSVFAGLASYMITSDTLDKYYTSEWKETTATVTNLYPSRQETYNLLASREKIRRTDPNSLTHDIITNENYSLMASYDYKVGDKVYYGYETLREFPDKKSLDKWRIENPSRHIKIHYNTANPAKSTINYSVATVSNNYLGVVGMFILFIIGTKIFITGYTNMKIVQKGIKQNVSI